MSKPCAHGRIRCAHGVNSDAHGVQIDWNGLYMTYTDRLVSWHPHAHSQFSQERVRHWPEPSAHGRIRCAHGVNSDAHEVQIDWNVLYMTYTDWLVSWHPHAHSQFSQERVRHWPGPSACHFYRFDQWAYGWVVFVNA